MEEKERYELIGYCSYRDTETGVIGDNFVGVLNEQDKEIKQLKHQLHDLSKKIVDKVYKYLTDEHNWKKLKNSWLVNGECEYLKIILKSILKEYGGKDE